MTKKKRQLIFLWPYVEWGGAQIYFLAIMKLAKTDWDIVAILPRDSLPDILGFLDQLDVRYEFIDARIDGGAAPTLKRKIQRQWRRIDAEITSLLHLRRYDLKNSILHIEFPPWQSWILYTMLALRRANVFVTLHNFFPKVPKWREIILRTRLQFVSRLPGFHIFTSNQNTKDQLKGWVEPKFWERIPVTYTCVNPVEIEAAVVADLNIAEARRELNIDENQFLVLCVGQFVDRKGRWVFLDAAQKVIGKDKGVSFVWLTPKLPNNQETKRISACNLDENFQIVLSKTVGKNRIDILKFFRIADAFALPSYIEGLPIALLEAMALGLPSISTNVYAIPEAVKNLDTGLLIEAGDSDALAEAILKLKNDAELRARLSKNGSAFVLEHFDEREASAIAINAYKECFADAG